MFKTRRTAKIMCDITGKPYRLTVQDGQIETRVDITRSSLKVVKKAAMDIYGVKPKDITAWLEVKK